MSSAIVGVMPQQSSTFFERLAFLGFLPEGLDESEMQFITAFSLCKGPFRWGQAMYITGLSDGDLKAVVRRLMDRGVITDESKLNLGKKTR